MKRNNILLLVNSLEIVRDLKEESNITFLFPIEGFTVGFPNPFNINEIKEEGYIFVNRMLDNEGISNFRSFIKTIPDNIKGIVFDDIGVLNVLLEEKIDITKILFLNHMCSNYNSINAYLEYIDSVVVSTDITINEIDEILLNVTKPVVLYTFGHMNIMYSRRTLITNYNKYFNESQDKVSTLEEVMSHKKFKIIENEYGTVIYTAEPFNGLDLLEKDNVLFNLINTVFLSNEEVIELIMNPSKESEKYPYKYLSEKETIFKLKEEEKMIELLAPAGNLERLKIAYLYGADAVYVGGRKFSLRANAINFDLDELKEAADFAHSLNKKLYVTVNIVFHNSDFDGLKEYLIELSSINVDAVIVSDIAVIECIRKNNIPLEIHLSTQASTLNYEAALFYKKLGVKRVVLAREASREDIKIIKEKTGLDLECFIQGAMCTSISGKCVLSNVTTNRDSNRGGCAQICRWSFNINDAENIFSMTPKDLNMATYLKDMIDIGVNSFKVEGRMRSVYYIATVIYEYRRMLDKIKTNTLTNADIYYSDDIINRCANRESTPQFYDKFPTEKEQYFLGREEVSNQDFLGIVLKSLDGQILLEQRNYFKVGDVVEIFGPDMEPITFTIHKILDENKEEIDVARHPRMLVYLECPTPVCENAMMRLKVFDKSTYL